MKLNYCTLFDSNYLTRGLAMYSSLLKHSTNFNLYVFAFDDKCYRILKKLNLDKVVVVSLKEFENKNLLAIKKDRTRGEYCWTCTSSTILYCLEHYQLTNCTYIDADVYFFDDPRKLTEKMEKSSVMITKHNYAQEYDMSKVSGIYCVQFMTFINNADGMRVLRWWVKECLKWCYNRVENGKFGDQKYLDDWENKFKGVYVLDDQGGGVAPWNAVRFSLRKVANGFKIKDKKTGEIFRLGFYHFHDIRFYRVWGLFFYVTTKDFGYFIPFKIKKYLYAEYFKQIRESYRLIDEIDGDFGGGLGDGKGFMGNYLKKYLGI